MSIKLNKVSHLKEIYDYMVKLDFPYNYEVDFNTWEKSYLYDVDGEGRTLFSELTTIGAYIDDKLTGFIQYGKTAFGFDDNGEIADTISYSVVRNFYFFNEHKEVGTELLNEAVNDLSDKTDRIYAFFHYFGMSCYARHGKLFEKFENIHSLLTENGFVIEHENVFYSSVLSGTENTSVNLNWYNTASGGQQYCEFIIGKDPVGGCEVHFLRQENIAYLRWIFINENICGKGIGSKCMSALKSDLFSKGIMKFDTDTALTNKVAQHFYEKNSFVKKGLTRSYYRVL